MHPERERLGIQSKQRLACLHPLIVLHTHPLHAAVHVGADRDDVRLDVRVLGLYEAPALDVEVEAHQDRRQWQQYKQHGAHEQTADPTLGFSLHSLGLPATHDSA